jgi:predicted nucleic acid-binding protein
MTVPFLDTDVIIRLLTGDDPVKQANATALLQRVERGELTLGLSDTTVADAVFVLSSRRLYGIERAKVAAMLTALALQPHIRVDNRRRMLRALSLYRATSLDYGDAFTVADMEDKGSTTVYSWDEDYDRIPSITRREP